ncbi:hypothetical protein QBC45DRAFT_311186, partial [Copromyces sp. CBS 386.78]
FLTNIEDNNNTRFKATSKTTVPIMYEDFVPFKTYSKKRAKKIRRGSISSIEIYLGNKGIDIPSELLIIYPYL